MRSVEARHPRVGGANPPVGEGGERRGGSNIVYRHPGGGLWTLRRQGGAGARERAPAGRADVRGPQGDAAGCRRDREHRSGAVAVGFVNVAPPRLLTLHPSVPERLR